MKILHLSSVYAPHLVGGAERVVETLAEGATAAGHAVAVAHLAPAAAPPSSRQGVAVHPLAHRNPLWIQDSARHPGPVRHLNKIAALFNVLTTADLGAVLDEVRPDVVHSHSMVELPPMMWRAVRARGLPLVHTLHDYDLLCIRASMFGGGRVCERQHLPCAMFSRVKRVFHRHIDAVVGVSRGILDVHLAHGLFAHLPQARRHVIWNPVASGARVAPEPRAADAPLTLGFIGRLVPEKGLWTLLDACRRLPPQGWRLRIAGRAPGGDDAEIRRRCAGLPVELEGFVEPAAFFAGIDLLVVPPIWREPFGLTAVEAYAAGVPVLGADIGGVADIVGSVDPAALFPPGDAAALAERLQAVITRGRGALHRPDVSAVLARTAPATVLEHYLGVYRQAIAARERDGRAISSPAASSG